ncbi:TPA: YlaI family protein [Staphylococcus aureus]|nr:YlaI family protein [Staphylococcus aureus]
MRQVQCIICDAKVFIDERTTESKRLKNNPIRTFMCDDCKSRLDTPKQRAQHYPLDQYLNKQVRNLKM